MIDALRNVLAWFGIHAFEDPWVLLLLPALLAAVLLLRRRRDLPVDGGSDRLLSGLPVSLRARLAWLPGAVLAVTAGLLVLALARPQQGRVETRALTEGIDIQLVVDTSSSMTAQALEKGLTNLEVVKEVVADFIKSRGNDRMGIISFAGFPRTESPLTLDHAALLERLRAIETVRPNGPEDGTHIGVALGHAARKLKDSEAKSRIIVLLTDGEENGWTVTPAQSAALCAELGIKVYAVAAGREFATDLLGRTYEVPLRTELLEAVADVTGGRFFRAKDKDALQSVYTEIDALERTSILDVGFSEYVDLYPWFLVPASILLALHVLLVRGPWLEFAR